MILQLFTDGSVHPHTRDVGWGYLLVKDGAILDTGSGHYAQGRGSNCGEMMAIIQGLLILECDVPVHIVTDSDAALRWTKEGPVRKVEGAHIGKAFRAIFYKHDATIEVIKSGVDEYNRMADGLARTGCGLKPKTCKQWKQARSKQRRSVRLAAARRASWEGEQRAKVRKAQAAADRASFPTDWITFNELRGSYDSMRTSQRS